MFMSLPQVLQYRHRSRSSHLRDVAAGLCTRPVKLGRRSVAWLQPELEALRAAAIAGKSEAEIQRLVGKLHADRERSFRRVVGSGD